MTYSFALSSLMPELIILLGIFCSTIYGAFSHNKNKAQIITALSIILLLAASYCLLMQGAKDIETMTNNTRYLIFLSGAFILAMNLLPRSKTQALSIFEFPILASLSILGMSMMISSANYLVLYLGLELMSLPLYVLAAHNRNNEASGEAGVKYFILGALASGLLLFGISLQFGASASLDLVYFKEYSNVIPLAVFAKVFILTALFFKVAAAPFHMWAPDVYEGAPLNSTAIFATIAKVASIVIIGRLLDLWSMTAIHTWGLIIMLVAIASMTVGTFGALRQVNIQRLLAYSSIAHVGYILLLLVEPKVIRYDLLLSYIIIYLSIMVGIFLILQNLQMSEKYNGTLECLRGLARHNPFLAFCLSTLLFSLAGIPPLAGFFAKLYVIQPLIELKLYWLAVILVLASVVAAYYYLRLIKFMYFDETAKAHIERIKTPHLYSLLILTLVILNLVLFINPKFMLSFALFIR